MIENIQVEFVKMAKSIKRQLRKAAIEKMTTMSHTTLDELIAEAGNGSSGNVDEALVNFETTARTWSDLSTMSCALSNNHEAVKMVRTARKQLEQLVSYVVASARVYASVAGQCKEAAENMQVIRSRWISQVSTFFQYPQYLIVNGCVCVYFL